jgi:hypothetical protein
MRVALVLQRCSPVGEQCPNGTGRFASAGGEEQDRAVPTSRALVAAATAAYLANVALGTAVQTRLVDTSRHRWTHHALYIVTTALTVTAIVGAFAHRSPRGWLLSPALVPLALLPRIGHDAHALTGLAAAPWYAGALLAPAGLDAGKD